LSERDARVLKFSLDQQQRHTINIATADNQVMITRFSAETTDPMMEHFGTSLQEISQAFNIKHFAAMLASNHTFPEDLGISDGVRNIRFVSTNNQFVMRMVALGNLKTLEGMLPDYLNHFQMLDGSMLEKIVAMFKVQVDGNSFGLVVSLNFQALLRPLFLSTGEAREATATIFTWSEAVESLGNPAALHEFIALQTDSQHLLIGRLKKDIGFLRKAGLVDFDLTIARSLLEPLNVNGETANDAILEELQCLGLMSEVSIYEMLAIKANFLEQTMMGMIQKGALKLVQIQMKAISAGIRSSLPEEEKIAAEFDRVTDGIPKFLEIQKSPPYGVYALYNSCNSMACELTPFASKVTHSWFQSTDPNIALEGLETAVAGGETTILFQRK